MCALEEYDSCSFRPCKKASSPHARQAALNQRPGPGMARRQKTGIQPRLPAWQHLKTGMSCSVPKKTLHAERSVSPLPSGRLAPIRPASGTRPLPPLWQRLAARPVPGPPARFRAVPIPSESANDRIVSPRAARAAPWRCVQQSRADRYDPGGTRETLRGTYAVAASGARSCPCPTD